MMVQKGSSAPYILANGFNLNPMLTRLLTAKNDGYCRISNLRWGELNMPHVSAKLLKWNVKHLDIEENKQVKILVHIKSIHFPRLKILNISSNLIESLDGLQPLNLRNLEELNLSNNKIIRMDLLRKQHTFRLQKLNICNNPFMELGNLSQIPLMNLQVLVLENDGRKNESYLNIWQIVKLESEFLKSLYIRNIRDQFKVMGKGELSVLRNRFIHLNPGRNL